MVQYDNAGDVYDTGNDLFAQPSGSVASDLDGDTVSDDVTESVPGNSSDRFNENSTFYNPSSVPGYIGPDIYGGMQVQQLNATTINFGTHELADFSLRLQSTDSRLHLAIFFPTVATTLGSNSFIGFSSSDTGTPDGLQRLDVVTARVLIRTTGDNFFVSQTTFSDSAAGRVLDGTELATETFASYSPNTDLNFDQTTAFTTTTAQLNALGITGYGLYAEDDAFSGSRRWITFSKFYADAELVPEPASFALLGLGGLLMLSRRKHGTTR